jgi:peroxiredoxin-like protein
MQELPHRYRIEARAAPEGAVELETPGVAALPSAPPVEFDGPGDLWSPETLLLAAVADCFVLSFRVIAHNSKLAWTDLACGAQGVLDRADGALRFTEIHLHAALTLPPGQRLDRAERLLQRAEKSCLVSNSLATPIHLETEIREASS